MLDLYASLMACGVCVSVSVRTESVFVCYGYSDRSNSAVVRVCVRLRFCGVKPQLAVSRAIALLSRIMWWGVQRVLLSQVALNYAGSGCFF